MTTEAMTPPERKSSTLAYVLAGTSFIPLLGVPLGLLAIVLGISWKTKGPIFVAIAGIMVTVALYGSLYYFGFVANYGPYAGLKKQLAVQLLDQDKGAVLVFKDKYGRLPSSLDELQR